MQLLNLEVIGVWILFGYLISRVLRRNDVADGMWGLGFLAVAAVPLLRSHTALGSLSFRAAMVLAATALWSLRLSTYLWVRLLGKSEDARYAQWRKDWGKTEPLRAFFQVFVLQGIILCVAVLPITWAIRAPDVELGALSFAGATLWLLGFIVEVFADAQMAAFKRSKSRKPLTTGLWALSRHPNYLGEIAMAWGLFLIAAETPGGWMTVVAPLLMTFLLTRVSGVTMLDRLLQSRSSQFGDYARSTRALFLWSGRGAFTFFGVGLVMVAMDFFWLGLIAGPEYTRQLHSIARIVQTESGQGWDPIYWAAAGVYFFLALGVQFFAVRGSAHRLDAAFRGSILGLVIYGVYDWTNLALVANWPPQIALMDMAWGALLCGCAAAVGYRKSASGQADSKP